MAAITNTGEDAAQCVWFQRRDNTVQRCDSIGTVQVGLGLQHWKVCKAHISWWNPSFMPTWWYWLSATLLALIGTAILLLVLLLYAL